MSTSTNTPVFPLDPASPSGTDVSSLGFELGMDNGDGTWSAPATMNISDISWVAFVLYDGANSVASDLYAYGMRVDNVSNLPGDLIYNDVMTESSSLLPSVSNYVVTALIAEHSYDLALTKALSDGYSYQQEL